MEFGKNRVQYQDFFWQYLRYPNYNCYFYQGGQELAKYSGERIRKLLPEMEKTLDFRLEEPLEFIIYNSHSDFKQSNIGLNSNENTNIGGTTRIVGSKVFLYFEGDHNKLDIQIKTGSAQVMVNQMMYGGSLRDMLRSSTLLNLPEWYINGLVSYLGENWNDRVDQLVRDGVSTRKFERFNQLEGEAAKLAGHSIWNFIAEVYGEKVIPNILYMTRVSRNVESGFLFVLGLDMNQLTAEYIQFYKQRYEIEEGLRNRPELEEVKIKQKKERVYQQFKLSPNGKKAAYVTNQLGQYKVYITDLETGRRRRIARGEHKLNRITDYSYPILTWNPNGEVLAFVTEKKGKVLLNFYYPAENKKSNREIFQIEKILSLDYANDGKTMVFSGVYQGQTDLYKYYIVGNRQEQLTNDIYDDFYPSFIDNDKRILFSSNRPNDTLNTIPPAPTMLTKDLYILDLSNTAYLERITRTPGENEEQPFEYGIKKYTYLSNKNGVVNRFYAQYDSTISSVDTTIHYRYFSSSYPLSNFNRSILEHSLSPGADQYNLLMYLDGKYHFYKGKISDDEVVSLSEIRALGLKSIKLVNFDDPTKNRDIKTDTSRLRETSPHSSETFKIYTDSLKNQGGIDFDNYQFGEIPEGNTRKEQKNDNLSTGYTDTLKRAVVSPLNIADSIIPEPEQRNYNINFTTDQILTQIDNNFNNQFYQLLSGPDNVNPGLSGYLKMGASDLFEDYRITGGVRSALSFSNLDYMLAFQDLKGRIDKTYFGQRQTQFFKDDTSQIGLKLITYNAYQENKYAFSDVAAFKFTLMGRMDQAILTGPDQNLLREPNAYLYQIGGKIEYVFDNTLKKGTNLYNGTRYKLFAEFYTSPGQKKSDLQVYGIDFRHYEKLHRSLILAFRLAASTSTGNHRLLYFMGGVDRWLYLPKSDPNSTYPVDLPFYYQSLATPFRGSLKNVRNGNSFVLMNTELRWPIIKYFSNKPLKSDFLESLQIIGFSDIGTAWTGKSPYSEENQFNTTKYEGNPIVVTVKTQMEPIVSSYGFGLRGRLLGYYMRADWAWSIQDRVVQPRQFYLSLSLDF